MHSMQIILYITKYFVKTDLQETFSKYFEFVSLVVQNYDIYTKITKSLKSLYMKYVTYYI